MRGSIGAGLFLAVVLAACNDLGTSGENESNEWSGEGGDDGQGGDDGIVGEGGGSNGGNAGGTVASGDFINGDFEQGPGTGWDQQPYPLIHLASEYGVAAYSGQYVAVLGPGQDDRESVTLSQQVTLRPCRPMLQFAVWLQSDESCDPPWWDDMGLYVNGEAVLRNDRLCNTDSTGGWQEATVDLSAYSGQTVLVSFRLSTVHGDPLASTVGLDALRIVCQ